MAQMRWVVFADHYSVLDQPALEYHTFKLDPRNRRVDEFHQDTAKGTSGGHSKGIYKVSANTLIVCFDPAASQYPKSFAAEAGSHRVLYRFEREHH